MCEVTVTLDCPYCKYSTTSDRKAKVLSSLIGHVGRKHGISSNELKASGVIDVSYFDDIRVYSAENSKKRLRNPDVIGAKNLVLLNAIGDIEYSKLPTCAICGYKGRQLYKHINTIHEMLMETYKTQYGTSSLATDEYLEYLSESRMGENNPMYNNGSSDKSPFSIEFYLKKGYSQLDAEVATKTFIDSVVSKKGDETYSTKIEYYMNKYSIDTEEATDMLKDRQATNSVENIAKSRNISMEEAKLVRDAITNKWITTLNSKTDEELAEITRKKLTGSNSISKSSLKFFNKVIQELGLNISAVKYNKTELIIQLSHHDKRKYRSYDFTYNNKIIEYNGDRTHANPNMYTALDIPHKHMKKFKEEKTAQQIWDYDREKIELAKSHGYELLVIWHSDVKRNIYRELRKCKEFLGI